MKTVASNKKTNKTKERKKKRERNESFFGRTRLMRRQMRLKNYRRL
jgi:hypothetical protein